MARDGLRPFLGRGLDAVGETVLLRCEDGSLEPGFVADSRDDGSSSGQVLVVELDDGSLHRVSERDAADGRIFKRAPHASADAAEDGPSLAEMEARQSRDERWVAERSRRSQDRSVIIVPETARPAERSALAAGAEAPVPRLADPLRLAVDVRSLLLHTAASFGCSGVGVRWRAVSAAEAASAASAVTLVRMRGAAESSVSPVDGTGLGSDGVDRVDLADGARGTIEGERGPAAVVVHVVGSGGAGAAHGSVSSARPGGAPPPRRKVLGAAVVSLADLAGFVAWGAALRARSGLQVAAEATSAAWVPVFAPGAAGPSRRPDEWMCDDQSGAFEAGPWRSVAAPGDAGRRRLPVGFVQLGVSGAMVPPGAAGAHAGAPVSPVGVILVPAGEAGGTREAWGRGGVPRQPLSAPHEVDDSLDVSADGLEVSFAVSEVGGRGGAPPHEGRTTGSGSQGWPQEPWRSGVTAPGAADVPAGDGTVLTTALGAGGHGEGTQGGARVSWGSTERARWRRVARAAAAAGEDAGPGLRAAAVYGVGDYVRTAPVVVERPAAADGAGDRGGEERRGRAGAGRARRRDRRATGAVYRSVRPAPAAGRGSDRARSDADAALGLDTSGDALRAAVGRLRLRARAAEEALRSSTVALRRTEGAARANEATLARARAGSLAVPYAGGADGAVSAVQGPVVARAGVELRRLQGLGDAPAVACTGEEEDLWRPPRGVMSPSRPDGGAAAVTLRSLQRKASARHGRLRAAVQGRAGAAQRCLEAEAEVDALRAERAALAAAVVALRRRQLWRRAAGEASGSAQTEEEALSREIGAMGPAQQRVIVGPGGAEAMATEQRAVDAAEEKLAELATETAAVRARATEVRARASARLERRDVEARVAEESSARARDASAQAEAASPHSVKLRSLQEEGRQLQRETEAIRRRVLPSFRRRADP